MLLNIVRLCEIVEDPRTCLFKGGSSVAHDVMKCHCVYDVISTSDVMNGESDVAMVEESGEWSDTRL